MQSVPGGKDKGSYAETSKEVDAMAKKPTKRRRTQSEIARAMFKPRPEDNARDPARAVQEMHRARGSMSPLAGAAGLFGPLAGLGAMARKGAKR